MATFPPPPFPSGDFWAKTCEFSEKARGFEKWPADSPNARAYFV
jgi:hypothetical protein